MATELTTSEFLEKIGELRESHKLSGTSYDAGLFQIRIDSAEESFLSPKLLEMSDEEYIPFRKLLDAIMPECDREKGYYW